MRAPLLLVLALVILAPSRAFADEASARIHFKKAIDLYDKRNYEAALTEFQIAYKEKPSAGIKQNIALSLKGLNRPVDAAMAFDEALDEGKDTLKPQTRAAIEHELADLSKTVATVNIATITEDKKPVEGAVVSVQPANGPTQVLASSAHRRPIRLMPGIYTFTAHAPGMPDPPEKKFALVSGPPVDTAFVFGARGGHGAVAPAGQGTLVVRASNPEASIRVDGVELGHGTWSGAVPAGVHKVEVSMPGWRTMTSEATVPAGATVEHPVKLLAAGEAPAEYVAPEVKAPKPKRFYLAVMGSLDVASYRLSDDLDEPPGGTRRGFLGATVGARGGYAVSKLFAIELLADVGVVGAKYRIRPSDAVESKTNIAHWELMPVVRFSSKGKARFTAGTGFGLHGMNVEGKLARTGSTFTTKGQGVGFAWLVDAGAQVDVGSIFFEGLLFMNVHGVGPVEANNPPEGRFLLGSPAVRGGLRLGLGIPF